MNNNTPFMVRGKPSGGFPLIQLVGPAEMQIPDSQRMLQTTTNPVRQGIENAHTIPPLREAMMHNARMIRPSKIGENCLTTRPRSVRDFDVNSRDTDFNAIEEIMDSMKRTKEETPVSFDTMEDMVGASTNSPHPTTRPSLKDLLNAIYGTPKKKGRNNTMSKKEKDSMIDIDELMDMMGRRSLRRAFRRNLDNVTNLALGVATDTFHEFAENNLYATLVIFGHYDTFISKSSVKVLLRYLYPKYGKHILMDVDGNFSMCSISIEKIKKSVLGFPELVNKTIRPGIYWVKLSDIGKGTYMIVVKHKLYSEGDISENGIRSEAKNFKTTIIFVGERKLGWKRRVQKEIDEFCSNLVTTSASSDKIRVQSMGGGGDNAQNDIIIRPMQNLMFPQKAALLDEIQTFLDSEKIYKDNGIPYRKGYLFHGPRGTGKTSFAFSLAEHFHMECVSVDLSYFDSNGGANAFNGSNTIYIVDEIDAQLPKSRVSETHEAITVEQQKIIDRLHKLLKAMDDMNDGCIIIGTTNFPDRLDPAIVRSGRFDKKVNFDNLDKKFATLMCKNRGLDPDEILTGEKFPINPAYLEQKLIDALLRKNNIEHKQLKSADEVISEEFGLDALERVTSSTTSSEEEVQIPVIFHEPATLSELHVALCEDLEYPVWTDDFVKAAKRVLPEYAEEELVDDDGNFNDEIEISPENLHKIYALYIAAVNERQADYTEEEEENPDNREGAHDVDQYEDEDDEDDIPVTENSGDTSRIEVISSDASGERVVEDTEDEDDADE